MKKWLNELVNYSFIEDGYCPVPRWFELASWGLLAGIFLGICFGVADILVTMWV